MKKLCVAVSAIAILAFAGSAFAQNATIGLKVGGAGAKDSEKPGLNTAVALGVKVNPYFELFAKPGFVWFSWDKGLGIQKDEGGGLHSELKKNVDAYCFPLLAGAKINFADAKESIGIVPYVSLGAGYTWMRYKYEIPAYTDLSAVNHAKESNSSTFKGFTWEVLGGFAYPFTGTTMSLDVEGGYRGMKLTKDSAEVNMSGWVANLGVTFTLGEQ
jgi:hypothetical protein